ncbi:hypothetical protein [Streptomyces netropsis]|uniref:Anti-sigma factor RsiW n=1 Tax=Streptomyces netropsis TaxID=55404 RepID=A0A7W7LHS3_STRNE|nr:hypothetical protein [Streptomyces netropsis]MBB4890424.1 anti-sigma factor RsiW [Streptomyces netropsis]GGR46017.1 hypothetical protein GCM10010219_59530 [Streptomyces netropsis]
MLLDTCHDAIQAFGPKHQVVLWLRGESAFDRHVAHWAAAHTAATAATSALVNATVHPADEAAHGEGATWARDRALIAQGPMLCPTFCAEQVPCPQSHGWPPAPESASGHV